MVESAAVRKLARRLNALEKGVRAISTQPQLPYSSLEGGAIDIYDEAGDFRASVGEQYDGTTGYVPFVGVIPAKPTLPLVTPDEGFLRVYWDGTWADGTLAAMDFARVMVYALPLSEYATPEPTNQGLIFGGFYTALGGEITVATPPGVEYAVYIVGWNQAGQFGPASDVAFGTSVPPVAVGGGSDGLVPTATPVAIPIGMVGSILTQWAPITNADPVDYEVHVKIGTDSTPPTPGDAATRVAQQRGTQVVIRRMGDGSPLAYDTDYNIWVIAHDEDGYGPVPADPVVGRMVKITSPDVAAEYVYAGEVAATQITGGNVNAVLAILGRLVAGVDGANRVELGPDGLTQYNAANDIVARFPVAEDEVNRLAAEIVTNALTVEGNMKIQGLQNEVSVDSEIVLAAGVTPPSGTLDITDWVGTAKKTDASDAMVSGVGPNLYTSDVMETASQLTWDGARNRIVWIEGYDPTPGDSSNGDAHLQLCAYYPSTGAITKTSLTSTANPRIPAGQIPSGYRDPDAVNSATTGYAHKTTTWSYAIVGDTMYLLQGRLLYDMNPPGIFGYTGNSFWYVYKLDLTNHQINSTNPWLLNQVDIFRSSGPGVGGTTIMSATNMPRLHRSADGNIWVSQVKQADAKAFLRKRSASTFASLSTMTLDVAAGDNTDHVGSLIDTTLAEGARMVAHYRKETRVFQANPATGTRYTTEDWDRAGAYIGGGGGIVFDGSRFYSASGAEYMISDTSVPLYQHTTDASTDPIHWAYTFFDNNASGSTHETTLGPILTKTRKRRWGQAAAWPTYGRPPVAPGDVDSPNDVRIYAAKKATTPTVAEMLRQTKVIEASAYWTFEGARTDIATGLPDTTQPSAPTVNTFPEGNSAILKSSSGGFLVRGNGTGAWPAVIDPIYTYVGSQRDYAISQAKTDLRNAGETIPAGGTTGQILTKDSGSDFDASWQDSAYVITAKNMADLPSTYPIGPTQFNAANAPNGGADYPAGAISSVITQKSQNFRVVQWNVHRDVSSVYIRGGNSDGSAWSAWRRLDADDTGWITQTTGIVAGEAPFATTAINFLRYRRVNKVVHLQFSKQSTAVRDMSANTSGDFLNLDILGAGTIPAAFCPEYNVGGFGKGQNDTQIQLILNTTGAVVWVGGFPRSYSAGPFEGHFTYFVA